MKSRGATKDFQCNQLKIVGSSRSSKENSKIIVVRNEDVDLIYKKLTNKWEVKKPDIIISCVESRTKALRISGKQKSSLKQSLLRIVKEKKTWIFTDGMDKGIAKLVGEVEFVARSSWNTEVKVIGMGCWKLDRENLIMSSKEDRDLEWINLDENNLDEFMLNAYHSAFICYQAKEEEFRAKFEQFVTNKSKAVFCQILVGGDENSIEFGKITLEIIDNEMVQRQDSNNIQGKLDCVKFSIILKGSKDAADDICDIIESSKIYAIDRLMDEKLEKYCTNDNNGKKEKLKKHFKKYVTSFKKKVFVHDINHDHETLDSTIVKCILQALKELDEEKAFQWTVDFDNKDFINFETFKKKKVEERIKLIVDAVAFERRNFIDIIFQEVNLNLFINEESIKTFNEKALENNKYFHGISFHNFRKRICFLSNEIVKHVFEDENITNECGCFQNNRIRSISKDPRKYDQKNEYINHLFYWALFTDKHSIAKVLWKHCEFHMRTALIASVIYRSKEKIAERKNDKEKTKYMNKLQQDFENLAISILQMASANSMEKTKALLKWNYAKREPDSCIDIARKNFLIAFSSQSAFRFIADEIWLNTSAKQETLNPDDKNNTKKKICLRYMTHYLKAPITKFTMNVVTYLAFLIAYSYFMLIEINSIGSSLSVGYRKTEYLVYIFVASFAMEEFRQFFTEFNNWKSSKWNLFDSFIYLIFLIAFILRFTVSDNDFIYCRSMFAIALSMFYLRFLQFYSVFSVIGPKLIMISEMVNDIFFIVAIYMVSLLAYGTLSVSLITPNLSPTSRGLFNVLYYPYWQLYGTINETFMRGECENCTQNRVALIANVIFLLFTNILLINLLIAMFGKTVDRVQNKSYQLWAYIYYETVFEFSDRPILPPPFNIFEIIWLIFQKLRCCKGEEYEYQEKDWLSKDKELKLFDKICMEMVLLNNPMFKDFETQEDLSLFNCFMSDAKENYTSKENRKQYTLERSKSL